MNAAQQRNGIGEVKRGRGTGTLKERGVSTEVQDTMRPQDSWPSCKDFDNLYYEICNEPYFPVSPKRGSATSPERSATLKPVGRAAASHRAEHRERRRGSAGPRSPMSIFNFHYARPRGRWR